MRRFGFVFVGLCLAALVISSAPLIFLAFDTRLAQPGQMPSGWRVKVNRGTPDVAVVSDPQGRVLRLRSRCSSFALERGLDVDLAQYPFLSWNWKVTELPRGGDFRHTSSDDQAAQLLVAFGDRRVLTYIWDSTAPKNTVESASSIPLLHVFAFVCRSGASELNRWLPEVRNVADDYERAYGHRPSHSIKGIRIQINSQHTGTSAESYFGDIAFRSTR